MAVFKFENNAKGALENAIGAGDSSFSLEAGDGAQFPSISAGEQFKCIMVEGSNSEWMIVTDRAGDVFTVTRGTPPKSFNAGAVLSLRMDHDILNLFFQKGSNRIVTEDPDGSLAADYFGEEVYNSTNGRWWKSVSGLTWLQMGIPD